MDGADPALGDGGGTPGSVAGRVPHPFHHADDHGNGRERGGSVFVALQEVPSPTASAGAPLVFRYFILGGTGAYRGASGTGTADLTLTTPPTPSASTIPSPVTGNFTLVFNPILPPAT